jgi:hypothetical protein
MYKIKYIDLQLIILFSDVKTLKNDRLNIKKCPLKIKKRNLLL